MDGTGLFASFMFSLIGFAVFTYGRKQRLPVPAAIGVALMGYVYFVDDVWAITGIGIALLIALYLGMRLE